MPRLGVVGVALLACGVSALPLSGQSNRELIEGLFVFGDCGEVLCLDVDLDLHGQHFIPAAAASNAALLAFLTDAIGRGVGNLPLVATSGGYTPFFDALGNPARDTLSPGPIFSERHNTLGRGRTSLGLTFTGMHFSSLNGIPLDNLAFTFAHEDSATPQPLLGSPDFERDLMNVRVGLDVDLIAAIASVAVGLSETVDVGIAVPIIRTSVSGRSEAQIIPVDPDRLHSFAEVTDGTGNVATILRASQSISGQAFGIGDIALRTKIRLGGTEDFGVAFVADARLPTGSEDELLGSGDASVRLLGVIGGTINERFSPHLNVGYVARTGDLDNDAILASAGFDHRMTSRLTLAFDLFSEFQLGDAKVTLPGDIAFEDPAFPVEIATTSIPLRRLNYVNAAMGFKYVVGSRTVIVANALIPTRQAGLQADIIWTAGFEFTPGTQRRAPPTTTKGQAGIGR